jgi:hypothetical protein
VNRLAYSLAAAIALASSVLAMEPLRPRTLLMQAAAPAIRSGCLLYKDSQFIILDEDSRQVVELHGLDLDLNLGNRVEVSGTIANIKPTVFLATVYMNVSTVSPKAQGGCLTVASALDARTGMPPNPGGKSAKQKSRK